MPASWQTFTHAARHCSSVPYCCSNSASVSPCMIARIDPISCPSESILHRFRSGRKGGRLVDKREIEWLARHLEERKAGSVVHFVETVQAAPFVDLEGAHKPQAEKVLVEAARLLGI